MENCDQKIVKIFLCQTKGKLHFSETHTILDKRNKKEKRGLILQSLVMLMAEDQISKYE